MHDAIDALERAVGGVGVADVADDELDRGGQIRRRVAVDLRLEAVEHDDLVAALEEGANEVRADEARAAGDQSLHDMTILAGTGTENHAYGNGEELGFFQRRHVQRDLGAVADREPHRASAARRSG